MSTAYGPQDQDGAQTPDGAQPGQPGDDALTTNPTAGVLPPPPAPGQPAGGYGMIPPPPPPPAWFGAPGQPGDTAPGGGQHASKARRPHRRVMVLAAGVSALALAAGGTAWATSGSGSLSTAAIASKTDPGLVDVISTLGYQHAAAEGTGMVLTSTGEVLTNNHVVAGATSIKVRDIGNGHTYTAKVVGYSDSNDVAVLQLTGASGLSVVTIGDSATVTAGQKVVALGNAEGKGGTPSVATGKVAATGASITAEDQGDGVQEHLSDMIRTNAPIEPGDSGGPLLNTSGEVIGMDTAASTSASSGVGTTAAETTTAFSIPINRALTLVHQIEGSQSSTTVHIGATAFLGVEVSTAGSGGSFGQSSSGVTVAGSVPGTAAASIGLADGDTIVSVGGHTITSDSGLQTVIEGYHPGDKVSIVWTDQLGQSHSATVTLTAGPTG